MNEEEALIQLKLKEFEDKDSFVVNLVGREIPEDLNDRQKEFLNNTKFTGTYTNSDYQEMM